VDVYDTAGSIVGTMELSDEIFAVPVNEHAVHAVVTQHLANLRQGTKSAKTRAEVSGGGKKPWRQKGTGRARQGSTRAPQWKGGGVVFAPKPRDFSFKLNKKLKRLALKSVLSSKVSENKLIALDSLPMGEIKTKEMKKTLDALKVAKALVALDAKDKDNNRRVVLSARNIPNVKTTGADSLNVYDILKYDFLVATKEALSVIQEVYA
jgi:large subunit ribosomal protein L4